MLEVRRVLDDLSATTGWGVINGTMELGASPFAPYYKGIKVTHTEGTYVTLQKFVNKKRLGRYIRFWMNVHGSGDVGEVVIYLFTGPVEEARYYWLPIRRSNGKLVDGEQVWDFHLNEFNKVNNPDSRDDITLIKFTVTSADGRIGSVTFGKIESVKRRPYIVFVNDSPREECIYDILPMLISRGLKSQVQVLDVEATAYKTDPENPGSRYVPLSVLRELRDAGWLDFGVHANFQQATDDEFYGYLQTHTNNLLRLGLSGGHVHCTAFQSNFVNQARHQYASRWLPMIRRGAFGIPQKSYALNGLHLIPPATSIYAWDIPAAEFSETTTEANAAQWILDAITLEQGLYVFGHGSNRFQSASRSPIAVYQAFLVTHDQHRDEIDWLTPTQWYDRFKGVRGDLR